MKTGENIFEKTYRDYLRQLRDISFESVADRLGAEISGDTINVALFKDVYSISHEKISDSSGNRPSHDICVILARYILLCPENPPRNHNWISFRNFRDSGPLTNYFTNEVENAIASFFSGRIHDLIDASGILGGYPPVLCPKYDFSLQFDALPRIPVMLLYNDKDKEFPAGCGLLFEDRAEKYLDAECIAMLGYQLVSRLRNVSR